MALFVKFWGTRGLIPTPGTATRVYGANTACVEVRSDDAVFICDAGSGLRDLGKELATRSPRPEEVHLFITHHHWDHIQGFPFLALYFHEARFRVYSGGKDDGALKKLVSGQGGSDYFPGLGEKSETNYAIQHLNGESRDIGGVKVRSFRLNHPGDCYGFIFEKDGRKIVYAPDHEIELQPGDKFPDPSSEGGLRKAPAALMELVQNADLLIMDAQYDDQQYARRKGWGHSSCFSVTDLAVRAKVKSLALFHHDPESSDNEIDSKIQACYQRAEKNGGEALTIFAAREGVELKF